MANQTAKTESDDQFKVVDVHKISLQDLCERLDSDPHQGLSEERAKEILARDGPNKICAKTRKKLKNHDENIVFPESATVVRGGVTKVIPCEQLVVGDVVIAKAGEKIPADIRVISCTDCKVDNSSFTGEPDPVALSIECTWGYAQLGSNIAAYSIPLVQGSVNGMVVRTGDRTTLGRSFPYL